MLTHILEYSSWLERFQPSPAVIEPPENTTLLIIAQYTNGIRVQFPE
jgi:hypothetical protein